MRPEHADAVEGWVYGVDRGRYAVLVGDGTPDEHVITAARASELRRKSVVTGDRVDLVGDTSGEPGTLARIVRVQERTTLLRRSADPGQEPVVTTEAFTVDLEKHRVTRGGQLVTGRPFHDAGQRDPAVGQRICAAAGLGDRKARAWIAGQVTAVLGQL